MDNNKICTQNTATITVANTDYQNFCIDSITLPYYAQGLHVSGDSVWGLADTGTTATSAPAATSISKPKPKTIPAIKEYRIPNNNTVIVFFQDGTKTVATCDPEDTFNLEAGLLLCVLKKACGNNVLSQVKKVIKDQVKREAKIADDEAKRKEAAATAARKKAKLKEKRFQKKAREEARMQAEIERLKLAMQFGNNVFASESNTTK